MCYFLTRRVAKTEDEIENLKASVSTAIAAVSVINGNINILDKIFKAMCFYFKEI
jgi:hypothetical protein